MAVGAGRGELAASGTLREPEGSFAASMEEAFLGKAGPLRGSLSGTLSGGGVDIEKLSLETPYGNIALAGRLEREGKGRGRLRLASLFLSRGPAEARLAHPALVNYAPPGDFTTDDLSLAGPHGSLTLTGKLALDGDSDLTFEAAGLGSDGWLHGLFGDRVAMRGLDVRGQLTGSRRRPRARVEGGVAALAGAGASAPLTGRFELAYEPGALTVVAFEWSDGNGLRASAAGRLPVDPLAERLLLPGALELTARVRVGDLRALSFLFPASVEPHGGLEADLSLGGSWEEPTAEITARATNAGVSGIAALKGRAPISGSLAGALRGGVMEVRSLKVSSDEVDLEASGTWAGMPAPGRLLRREPPLRTGSLTLRGKFAVADLSLLRALAGNPVVSRGVSPASSRDARQNPGGRRRIRLDGGALDYGGDGRPWIESSSSRKSAADGQNRAGHRRPRARRSFSEVTSRGARRACVST
jgi:hypothetical protein